MRIDRMDIMRIDMDKKKEELNKLEKIKIYNHEYFPDEEENYDIQCKIIKMVNALIDQNVKQQKEIAFLYGALSSAGIRIVEPELLMEAVYDIEDKNCWYSKSKTQK